ncbi:hypothetical protein SEA_FRANCOB_202 [Streptomyces phage Francob]
MTNITPEQEQQSREFVKVAALAALHIQAVNSALEAGAVEELKASMEFGQKIAEQILPQVPEDIQLEVVMDLLGSMLGG